MSAQSPALVSQPPRVALLHLTTGPWVMQAICVAAQLGIADLLKDGPRSVADLAEAAGANPRSLYRLLRALASSGIFAEDVEGRFGLTPLAELLQSDVPGSMRAWALFAGEKYAAQMWGGLLESVKTGITAFNLVHGMPVFDFFAQHPKEGELFNEAMTSLSTSQIGAVTDAYDFSEITTLVDVAGGHGSLLSSILQLYPRMKGILADVPGAIEGARRHFAEKGLAERCDVTAIDFFEAVPAGGDGYIMKHIIHDWDDARCQMILRNCHRAMAGQGRLLIVDAVIPPGNDPEFGKWLDVAMIAFTTGVERTEKEFRDLLAGAGFWLTRIVPTKSPVSVIEAVPV